MATKIRDEVLRKNRLFDDTTSIYRRVALYMYQGFVPNAALDTSEVPELKAIGTYHEEQLYDHKGNPVGKRKIDTLNVPKLVTSTMKNLVLGEGYEVSIDDDESGEKYKWFMNLLKDNHFDANESDLVEVMLNTGDKLNAFAFRNGKIKLSYLNGFRYEVVEWEQGIPKSVVFFTDKRMLDKQSAELKYYTLLELHTLDEEGTYRIVREIYEGSDRYILEKGVEFNEYVAMFGNMVDYEEFVGVGAPMFSFTRLPTKNNKQLDSIRGLGLLVNSIDTVRNLDLTYDANNREIEMTQTKVIVPDEMLEHGFDKSGNQINHYNNQTRWYSGLNAQDGTTFSPQIFNPTIRQEQYHAKIQQDLDLISLQVGMDPGALSFQGQGGTLAVTATQVMLQHDRTHRTRVEIGRAVAEGWKTLLVNVYQYARYYNLINWEMDPDELHIKLNDSIVIDQEALFQRDMTAVEKGLMPKKEFLMKHYNLGDEEADEWLSRTEQQIDMGPVIENIPVE